MNEQILDELSRFATVEYNVPLSSMTTLRIGGNAKYVVYPQTVVALDEVMQTLQKNKIPFKVFGKGSNLLCSDDDYDGAIIRLDRYFTEFYFKDGGCTAQAGCSAIALAYEAMKNNLSGMEFASGIPGTIGGLTFMNAGAYKSCMKDIIEQVFVYRDGKLEWLDASECDFGYRHSIFHEHHDWIILAVKLALTPKDATEIKEVMDSRKERRVASQPLEYPSCGSVFRNPGNDAAWKYIDGIGYRGKQIGGAMVSDKHVNFIINKDHATAQDYLELAQQIQSKVKDKYDVDLVMEVEKFNWD